MIRPDTISKYCPEVICTVGYNEFDFLKKIKNTDPLMGAKLKSKTHLLNRFFDFLSRFLRVWLQSLKKILIWPKKKNFLKKSKKVSSKTSLTNMSKSEKSAFFRHGFANNFFLKHFFNTFSTDSKSAWNSAFFDTFCRLKKKKNFWRSH